LSTTKQHNLTGKEEIIFYTIISVRINKVGNWKNRVEESALACEEVEIAGPLASNSARSVRGHRRAQR
jgi:hypothetical protein